VARRRIALAEGDEVLAGAEVADGQAVAGEAEAGVHAGGGPAIGVGGEGG